MFKVKFTPYRKSLGTLYKRQTKDQMLISRDGRYQFLLDDDCQEADFWVVQGKGVRTAQTCCVAAENTIFLATEPTSVLIYPQKYLRQFAHTVISPPVLPWFVGFSQREDGSCRFSLDYDQLKAMPVSHEKTKWLSVITSDKAFTRGHLDRIRFVEKLKSHFGEQIDIFGRGFRPFDDKWDVLRPYRYHIAIENSSERDYWTEKIGDCYLAGTFPFYYGCPNLGDYFPQDAFLPIDIHRPDEAISRIEQAIRQDIYASRLAALAESKQLVLDKYNMFDYIAHLCDTMNAEAPKQSVTIEPCRSGLNARNLLRYTLTRNYYKLLAKLRGNRLKS